MHVDLGRILHLTCIYVTLIELNDFPAPPPLSLGQPRLLAHVAFCFISDVLLHILAFFTMTEIPLLLLLNCSIRPPSAGLHDLALRVWPSSVKLDGILTLKAT